MQTTQDIPTALPASPTEALERMWQEFQQMTSYVHQQIARNRGMLESIAMQR